jgi:hypothetical protein
MAREGVAYRFAALLLLLTGCAFRSAPVVVPEPLYVTHLAVRGSSNEDTSAAFERTTRIVRRASMHASRSRS